MVTEVAIPGGKEGRGITRNRLLALEEEVETDLELWLPFNGDAADQSVNEYTPTIVGATLASDDLGNPDRAYSFDGTDDSISYGTELSTWLQTHTFTFALRVFYGGYLSKGSSNNVIAGFGNPGNFAGQNGIIFYTTSTNLGRIGVGGEANVGGTFLVIQSNVNISGGWHHLAATYTPGGTLALYVDGIAKGTASGTATLNGTKEFYLGRSENTAQYAEAIITDVRVYNRILSQPEILALWEDYT